MSTEGTAATPAATDTPVTNTAPAAPVAAATPPVVAAPAPTPAAPSDAEPAWLPKRLQQAAETARKALLKELLGDEDEGKARLSVEELKRRRDAEKTEQQRLTEENASLKATAARVTELEGAVKIQADAALAVLTQSQREFIASMAGTDPTKVLGAIEKMRAAGMLAAPPPVVAAPSAVAPPAVTPPAVPVAPAPPANTAPAATAPPSSTGGTQSHLATLEDLLKTNPMLAASYRLANYASIEAERKARA